MKTNILRINKIQAALLIENSRGKFFSVFFQKKNGDIRFMHARKGVRKALTGKGAKYDPIMKTLSCVFDMQNNGYRMIDLNTIKTLTINKVTYRVM